MAFSSSPCARLWTSLTLKPDTKGQGTWTIGANRIPFGPKTWEITFDVTTPAELLHDVHANCSPSTSKTPQRPRPPVRRRDRAIHGVRAVVRPWLEPRSEGRRHADLPLTRRSRRSSAPLQSRRIR
ncbi:DUF317 domain-containing protein [Streptomyces sp. NPDC096323]|uniref:DUF317 domain-containing protein n=1 Tax=Streptomyces sp. NPDC096323 TaxID=3155822 RepID=UPI00332D5888